MIPTVVIRHPKERLSKCSLEPLRSRSDMVFLKARPTFRFNATGFLLLAVDAPTLQPEDAIIPADEVTVLTETMSHVGLLRSGEMAKARPLLILDSTWLLLPKLQSCLEGSPLPRSLPRGIRTAYPRTSKLAEDPGAGLASVEALYLAQRCLGHDEPELLAHYRWREAFLQGLV